MEKKYVIHILSIKAIDEETFDFNRSRRLYERAVVADRGIK